jgi:competence protein CoiA
MFLACSTEGARVTASPSAVARCPSCHGAMRAKCGRIVSWHWAHLAQADCDIWAEPDTEWHRAWQELVPATHREIVIGDHRADIVTPDGTVVELQHSYLSPDQIGEREQYYGRMIWIFDAQKATESGRLQIRNRSSYVTFRWKHPRKSVAHCRRPVFLDVGDRQLLLVRQIYPKAPCGGWGYRVNVETFRWFLNQGAAA